MADQSSTGYIRFPTIHDNCIVFTAEDDLWRVPAKGGRAERLTAGVAEATDPRFSPDGQWIAFTGCDEGPTEVYVMRGEGGPAQRLTYHSYEDADTRVVGWSRDGNAIIYSSSSGQPFRDLKVLFQVPRCGGEPEQLGYGLAHAIAYGPGKAVVIGRHTIEDSLHWKGYRGGTAGHLWVDMEGNGDFQRILPELCGHITCPCWVDERIYFISDHEGCPRDAIGNVYSCLPDGSELRPHTDQREFYARGLSTDGELLVFHAGGDLYHLDPQINKVMPVKVELPGPQTQRARKFVMNPARYLEHADLHPNGTSVALTTRRKAFSMRNWEGGVIQYGDPDGTKYRLLTWLDDGRLVAIADPGEPDIEPYLIVFNADGTEVSAPVNDLLKGRRIGHVLDLVASPQCSRVALANHRFELLVVDLASGACQRMDRSEYKAIDGIAWSPDGCWLAYGFPIDNQRTAIKICDVKAIKTYVATEPLLVDRAPAFDPGGKHLYFIGQRDYLNSGSLYGRPYLIPLRYTDYSSSLHPTDSHDSNGASQPSAEESAKPTLDDSDGDKLSGDDHGSGGWVKIDFLGITTRAVAFPVQPGDYGQVKGIPEGVIYSRDGYLHTYDFRTREERRLVIPGMPYMVQGSKLVDSGIGRFQVRLIRLQDEEDRYQVWMQYRSDNGLRVLPVDGRLRDNGFGDRQRPGSETGWLDLHRIKVSVQPALEWRQMYYEEWRLQRDYFWRKDMNAVDWEAVRIRYAPLIDRVASRAEVSDVIREMQAELRASHAFEWGGDYREPPNYQQGFLGVDWKYDATSKCYHVAHIVEGDRWNAGASEPTTPPWISVSSPLLQPAVDVREGDTVLAIDGQRLTEDRGPQALLVNKAGQEVELLIKSGKGGHDRPVIVRALFDFEERRGRYRDWVNHNRCLAHKVTERRVGYIHLPDMSPERRGFAEFYRAYRAEYDREGLIIDVRWNTGGRISAAILAVLGRKRVGYEYRQAGEPTPYPELSPRGPMVTVMNEMTASDGEIFSHLFKELDLGPRIGTRTWGGIIGIRPRAPLADNTETRQPGAGLCFTDAGCIIENCGVAPDKGLEVDCAPQDYMRCADAQLVCAIAEVMHQIQIRPSVEPVAEPWLPHDDKEDRQRAG